MKMPFESKVPVISPKAFVAPSAEIIGEVEIGDFDSIWFGAVLRGDIEPIKIGRFTNIQDNTVIHIDHDMPAILGEYITVGHNAILHGCEIADRCLIGMGAIVLSGAKIGRGSIVGAGSVVPERREIPELSLVLGIPGKVVKKLPEDTLKKNEEWALGYWELAQSYLR
ncbi:MAG TPA: gamma carbonic anhydrase family protein [Firmicutes bacterium]|nr:gamma carbonic anhydrase family protein [Bacillota bacterium]